MIVNKESYASGFLKDFLKVLLNFEDYKKVVNMNRLKEANFVFINDVYYLKLTYFIDGVARNKKIKIDYLDIKDIKILQLAIKEFRNKVFRSGE